MLLSVIIPLYNNAPYLRDCVDSLYRQGIENTDFEVIIIDDGSTDNGGRIADQIAVEHTNVRVYHQANAGTGRARNAGLLKAQGEYIHFVDPDDFMLDNSYRYVTDKLLTNCPDIICFGYVKDGSLGNEYQEGKIVYQGKSRDYYSNNKIRVNLPFKWLKRSFIQQNQLEFPSISYGEDSVFTWNALRYESLLLICNSKLYSYRTNFSSAIMTTDILRVKDSVENLIYVNYRLKDFSKDYIHCPAVKTNFTHKYSVLFNRVICTPYSYDEIKGIFERCANIGIEHLVETREIWWMNYIYHHPKLYSLLQRFILTSYFGYNYTKRRNGDFLSYRLTDGRLIRFINRKLSYSFWRCYCFVRK